MFIPVHGVVCNGRWYGAWRSPVKKLSKDDTTLLKVHRTQVMPFFSKARFRCVVAGRRWGKTHWTCIELVTAASLKPKQKVWYVAPTYAMAKQIAWEKLKEIIPESWVATKVGGGKKINETSLTITLRNGSQISLKGADRPDSLRGVGVHFLVMDEYQDFKVGTWELVLRATLSDTLGRAIFIGTPKSFNQLHKMYERGQKKLPGWESWQFKTSDSPFVMTKEIEDAKHDLDPRTFRQEYEASFETMAGRVYYDFDRHKNVRRCPYDPSLPTMLGQDFNVNPMSTSILQRHGDELWAVGEISLKGANTEETCRAIIDEYGWEMRDKATVYPDPAGANRGTQRGESDHQIFREWGFNRLLFHRKHPSVRDRIASTNRLICDATGARRLYVDPSCVELIKGYEQLIFKEGTNEPDKSLDIEHMTDAAGYAIEYEYPIRKSLMAMGFSR